VCLFTSVPETRISLYNTVHEKGKERKTGREKKFMKGMCEETMKMQ
jgi:hypothetical protein